ncbi:hypothetical protein EDD37DRAFT_15200 [Exophiala viscosa]|uniref:uncharacterized protein n=1 Tax=Exophiala viscosa TaxID=2486360 RepID=UPI002198906C|nr:hypothetical protein EDD37DRAFT_15200 [Exophiala viscosa]
MWHMFVAPVEMDLERLVASEFEEQPMGHGNRSKGSAYRLVPSLSHNPNPSVSQEVHHILRTVVRDYSRSECAAAVAPQRSKRRPLPNKEDPSKASKLPMDLGFPPAWAHYCSPAGFSSPWDPEFSSLSLPFGFLYYIACVCVCSAVSLASAPPSSHHPIPEALPAVAQLRTNCWTCIYLVQHRPCGLVLVQLHPWRTRPPLDTVRVVFESTLTARWGLRQKNINQRR